MAYNNPFGDWIHMGFLDKEAYSHLTDKVKQMKKYLVIATSANGQQFTVQSSFDDEDSAIASAKQQSANSNGKPFHVFTMLGIAQNPVSAISFTKVS